MGTLGIGYGSEWHLFYYLGRHRQALDQLVLAEVGDGRIEWLDVPSLPGSGGLDAEWQGIQFLSSPQAKRVADYSRLRSAWSAFWPQTGMSQNWDAVGMLHRDGQIEWLLIEAKGHVAEIQTNDGCRAQGPSRETIERAFDTVCSDLGVSDRSQWTKCHYQHANRLAVLWFMLKNDVPAHLVDFYFLGDNREGCDCPATEEGWRDCIAEQDRTLCLKEMAPGSLIEGRVHKIFLPVIRGIAGANVRTPLGRRTP